MPETNKYTAGMTNDEKNAYNQTGAGSSNEVKGIYRARVEGNNDPMHMGRVRVRIPSFTGGVGTKHFLGPAECPWAAPCVPWMAGEDFGSYTIPPVGTWVWVLFEDNDKTKPVYIGASWGAKPENSKTMGTYLDEDCSMGQWKTRAGVEECPVDEFNGKSEGYPERGIIFKSPKGHTVMYDDTDGEETFTICDRIGQMIKFTCPISAELNKGNNYRRRLVLAETDDQLSQSTEENVLIRSGLNDTDPERTYMQLFRVRCHFRCENVRTGYYTDYMFKPEIITIESHGGGSYSKRTMTPTYIRDEVNGKAWIHMTENHIEEWAARIDLNPF